MELRHLTLDVSSRANDNTPIALDLVVVEDPELLKVLFGLPANQWFKQREQLRRDYPKSLTVWEHELVPGQHLEFDEVPFTGQPAVGLLVYAGYNTPGEHRLRLDERRSVWLRLENKGMRSIDSE